MLKSIRRGECKFIHPDARYSGSGQDKLVHKAADGLPRSGRGLYPDRVYGHNGHSVRDGDATFKRLVVEHPGAAIVLAIDDDERVCLLRQYRHAVGQRLIELPAGVCDVEGEEPLETAKRELREEAELEAEHWQLLLSVYSTPGIDSLAPSAPSRRRRLITPPS